MSGSSPDRPLFNILTNHANSYSFRLFSSSFEPRDLFFAIT